MRTRAISQLEPKSKFRLMCEEEKRTH